MDKLEDYIRNNKNELDNYNPSPEIWERIKRGMRSRRPAFIWLPAAAMILVFLGTAILFYHWERKERIFYTDREIDVFIQKNDPRLIETEIYYDNLVNTLFIEASPMLTDYPDIEKELLDDLSEIDRICEDIKGDLKDNIGNQQVIEALINNYRLKIRLLEELLDVLKHIGNDPQNENNHEL